MSPSKLVKLPKLTYPLPRKSSKAIAIGRGVHWVRKDLGLVAHAAARLPNHFQIAYRGVRTDIIVFIVYSSEEKRSEYLCKQSGLSRRMSERICNKKSIKAPLNSIILIYDTLVLYYNCLILPMCQPITGIACGPNSRNKNRWPSVNWSTMSV